LWGGTVRDGLLSSASVVGFPARPGEDFEEATMRVVGLVGALIAAVVLAPVAGCGSGSDGGGSRRDTTGTTGSAAPASDPKEQLVVGIRALNTVPHRVAIKTTTGTVGTEAEGVIDPARRVARLTQSLVVAGKTSRTVVVVLGADVYVRYDDGGIPGLPPGTWGHLDGRRLTSLRAVGLGSTDDPSGKLAMVGAVTSIERTGPQEVRGTLDLTAGPGLFPDAVKALGDAARSAPWQARFDQQGRLVWLSVSIPGAGDRPAVANETSYSAFGEPVTVDRPPVRETVEAPETMYKLFGG
jgi:hypothetical protein